MLLQYRKHSVVFKLLSSQGLDYERENAKHVIGKSFKSIDYWIYYLISTPFFIFKEKSKHIYKK